MKPIHKIIGHTEEGYEKIIFMLMFNWADLYSEASNDKMQFLFANKRINKWFRIELLKLIAQFREDLKLYENQPEITSKERCRLFTKTIAQIYDIYPKALMDEYNSVEIEIDFLLKKKHQFNYN